MRSPRTCVRDGDHVGFHEHLYRHGDNRRSGGATLWCDYVVDVVYQCDDDHHHVVVDVGDDHYFAAGQPTAGRLRRAHDPRFA